MNRYMFCLSLLLAPCNCVLARHIKRVDPFDSGITLAAEEDDVASTSPVDYSLIEQLIHAQTTGNDNGYLAIFSIDNDLAGKLAIGAHGEVVVEYGMETDTPLQIVTMPNQELLQEIIDAASSDRGVECLYQDLLGLAVMQYCSRNSIEFPTQVKVAGDDHFYGRKWWMHVDKVRNGCYLYSLLNANSG